MKVLNIWDDSDIAEIGTVIANGDEGQVLVVWGNATSSVTEDLADLRPISDGDAAMLEEVSKGILSV